MSASPSDRFSTLTPLAGDSVHFYSLPKLAERLGVALDRLPFSMRVLLEAALRHCDGYQVTEDDVRRIAGWTPDEAHPGEIPFKPARVILQDFTGVPCVVDLAAMRDAMQRLGGDPKRINPLVPVDLVIDHSVQVDVFGNLRALEQNAEIEFERNRERYEFLRWGQTAFRNFRVVPPATGIVHQVNLEYLAQGVMRETRDGTTIAFPDSLVGTDSHTTMINGLGVVGWGVGGIEAEAVMLGQPFYMILPQVVGVRLTGALRDGVTATDLTLTITQLLRKRGVVDKFVEFYGPGLSSMGIADRATIANMAPEYGATMGFFPPDAQTVQYLERTNRAEAARLVETYGRAQRLFHTGDTPDPAYTDSLSLDLGSVEPSLAGPKRPQDRVALREMQSTFRQALTAPVKERGYGLAAADVGRTAEVGTNGDRASLGHGSVVIAAITSCTNTSNPSVMVGAGLLAQKAVARGLKPKPFVKTSLAPGSKVVTEYLRAAGLMEPLEALGFHTVGYGCTTCLPAGTPVLMADGTARPIEQLAPAGGERVFGATEDRRLAPARQAKQWKTGERECVELTFQDGRTLTCTPDHRLLCADGEWRRADALELGRDRVRMGLEAPLDEALSDEPDYTLEAGTLRFTLDAPVERARTLAFARLLGHLLRDGSISRHGQGRMNVGQALDRDAVLEDIERVTGKRPAGSRYDERKWSIVVPAELTQAMLALDGVTAGRKIDMPPVLPAFVLDRRCPIAVVREFMAGMFGADGHAPVLKRYGQGAGTLDRPAYSQSALPEHVAAARAMFDAMLVLLARCGVLTEGARVYEYATRHAASSYPAARDGRPRIEVRLVLPDGLSFVQRVGYRYCVDKALRASAAAAYWRLTKRVQEQRVEMAELIGAIHRHEPGASFGTARRAAAADLLDLEPALHAHASLLEGNDRFERMPHRRDRRFRPLHRAADGFPSPAELFEQMGVRDWFARLDARADADHAKRYCCDRDDLTLPTFHLAVLDRRFAGIQPVFDLEVDERHSFVAHGVVVHNCIGNSGPLPEPIAGAVTQHDLVAASVLSGNRNFEGRVNPYTRANYLASPPLVVAYALAGTVDIDMERDPLGTGSDGKPVYLRDVWPSQQEIAATIDRALSADQFRSQYANVFDGNPRWNAIPIAGGERYAWSDASTYIHEPPFFQGLGREPEAAKDLRGARVLVMVGDSVTTDHISPAGDIAAGSPAGRWLEQHGLQKRDWNSYGSRRGNDLVMVRGTFANIRLKNLLVPGTEGNVTVHLPSGQTMSVFDASERYRVDGTPLLVLAGKEYGTGSSRDWAAKGTLLLGVRAVLAESYERIHRSNLVGMGVLPLQYDRGQRAESLGLTGREVFDISGLEGTLAPRQKVTVNARREDGSTLSFEVIVRLDSRVEVDYYRNGGILPAVLRKLAQG